MTLHEMLTDPFILRILLRAAIVGVLVSLCAALLGVNMVLKRYSMIGDGLSHIGFCAVAFSSLIGMADFSLEISVPLVVLAAVVLLRMSENSKIKGDSAIALLSTGAVALGYIFYNFDNKSAADVCNSLFGSASVITITDKDMVLSVALSVLVLGLFVLFYNKIFALSFDENFCTAAGEKTRMYKLVLALLTGITVVVGMKMMGAILISALVVFPAVTAMRVCKTFRGVVICAGAISVCCFAVGFYAACRLSLQIGPTVVLANVLALAVFSLTAPLMSHRRR
ncbi:MAG: metal ABC transporter permease [Clostridia bacterium]|nr:metal ABC transporter permease [Clostridia bacterium]